jgi:hypothetical protein
MIAQHIQQQQQHPQLESVGRIHTTRVMSYMVMTPRKLIMWNLLGMFEYGMQRGQQTYSDGMGKIHPSLVLVTLLQLAWHLLAPSFQNIDIQSSTDSYILMLLLPDSLFPFLK